jgi:hypothetical protein
VSGGGVFLKRGGNLIEMVEQAYELEDHLQELIALHPNLLAGDQVSPESPRRWLLVSREAGLPSEEAGPGRWSVDHLLLDQDAIPTLVEVKRSTNSEIRRTVVGQMLDYAANAVTYWNVDLLRERFEAAMLVEGREAELEVAELVGDADADYIEFWERAKTNLRAGRIRLVFVADVIPTELQRVVEFLNERMTPTEVLAIEIRQYTGGGEQMLVPRILGQTAEARQKKPTGPRTTRQWDEPSFLEATEQQAGAEAAEAARKIIEWSRQKLPRQAWGKGATQGALAPALDHAGYSYWPFYLWTYGRIAFQFGWMQEMPPFDQESHKIEFLRRLNDVPGIDLPPTVLTRRPEVLLAPLNNEASLSKLFGALEWFVAQARNVSPREADV